MEKESVPLSFSHANIGYAGWATPSDHQYPDGMPSSYHVVLNETFFGDMSHQDGHWMISEQRSVELVAAAGKSLSDEISRAQGENDHGS